MTKKGEIIKSVIPDFLVGENNCVFAAYVVGPQILENDDPKLIGVPFIFYDGTTRHNIVNRLRSEGISYLSSSQLEELTKNAQMKGSVSETVHAQSRDITWQELLGGRTGPFGGPYVPYSFSIWHEDDIRNGIGVRTQADYNRIVREILPKVLREREATARREAQIEVFYSNSMNRLLSSLTRGWYGPRV